MLHLSAVVLAPIGQSPATLDELAGKFGVAVPLVIKARTNAAQLLKDGALSRRCSCGASILLLFEDAAEAAEFEKAAGLARDAVQRRKGATMGLRRRPATGRAG
jgi:hypothetical protein